jgi:osmotically-inducible protein OsmY
MFDPNVPATEADCGLEQRVIRFLETKHVPGLRHLAVQARGGIVLLSGRVHTYYEKQLCNQCCGRIPGLQELVNLVEVIETMPGAAVVA